MFPANELWGNRQAVCPYCKQKREMDEMGEMDEMLPSSECESCGKTFLIRTRFITEYDTVGDCDANGEMPHRLVLTWTNGESKKYSCKTCQAEYYNWELSGSKSPRLNSQEYVLVEVKTDE